ncbi:MAG TPA: adenylate/guanylate cyclase domain-containing protein [Thermohalobaculum sp.]|nr:adenylate/guanylate cyclase domain-containing protein [Thermohalobaculum sp.]
MRRLSAILAADVVGYSRLMGEDEAGTLAALRAHRAEIFDPVIAERGGRLVKLMGDGALVEFPSVVDAVEAALAIQQRNAEVDSRIRLRIGINLGDVIIDGDDIYGDGVNVAARLEALAEPGGICIASIVQESIGNRVEAEFADAGEHEVKGIKRPIRVFRWPDAGVDLSEQAQPAAERPSIAVLPFDNMSGDPDQEYFSDGICEDIITELSRFREFLVIARNSSFTYKGKAVKISAVCRDLGVRYVLEGSVRKSGSRIRVTGQLIDGHNGNHVWADRFDRTVDEIFDVQDEITTAIVNAVAPQLIQAEISRAYSKSQQDLDAWDRVMRARWHIAHYTAAHIAEAKRFLGEAIESNPRLVQAYAELGVCHVMTAIYGWSGADGGKEVALAMQAARTGVQLDSSDAATQAILGFASLFDWRFDDGLSHIRRAVQINPNSATATGFLCVGEALCGNYLASCAAFDRAFRLSPHDPMAGWWYSGKGIGAFIAEEYDDVLEVTAACIREFPELPTAYRQRAAAFAILDRPDDAHAALAGLLRLLPDTTVSKVTRAVPIMLPEAHERWLNALRAAGLPE